jgi:hypothetical protein
MKTGASIYSGKAKDDAAAFEAQQIRQTGKKVMAAAADQAQNEEDKARLLASRAVALAAAGGGSASAPGTAKLIADIHGEGAARARRAIYSGESRRDLLHEQAAAKKMEGEQAREAGVITAFGELAKVTPDMKSLYDKYKSVDYPALNPDVADTYAYAE